MKRRNSLDSQNTLLYAMNKRQKVDVSLQSLNKECLMKIFDYLTMDDLVNIVDYDNYFVTASWDVFSKKYRQTTICISNKVEENETVPWSVKMLKFFGPLIVKLKTTYMNKYRRFDTMLEEAVIANCRETVSEMIFENADYNMFHGLDEPFGFVRNIEFDHGSLDDLTPNLVKLFPRANSLELKSFRGSFNAEGLADEFGKRTSVKNFVAHFPTLQHFGISNWTGECYGKCISIDGSLLERFIEMNPQLTSLWIKENIDLCECAAYQGILDEFTASIDERLPNLEKLNIFYNIGMSYGPIQYKFKKLKELSIQFGRFLDCGMDRVCRIKADHLEVLSLIDVDAKGCLDTVSSNREIKRLYISGIEMVGMTPEFVDKMVQLVSTLPQLTELKLESDGNNIDQIIKLLTTCKLLTKLTVEAKCFEYVRTGRISFEERLNMVSRMNENDWKVRWKHTLTRFTSDKGVVFNKLVFDKLVIGDLDFEDIEEVF